MENIIYNELLVRGFNADVGGVEHAEKMKKQFIGLQHCKCGMSWKRDIGFLERTPDMVFGLRHTRQGESAAPADGRSGARFYLNSQESLGREQASLDFLLYRSIMLWDGGRRMSWNIQRNQKKRNK